MLWWGLFDAELYVEHGDDRFGPFDPVGGPVPLHRYRKHRKSKREARVEEVATLAARITVPRSALTGEPDLVVAGRAAPAPPSRPFVGPAPFQEVAYANEIKARLAIADELRLPLGKLSADDLLFIGELLGRTLVRAEVIAAVRERFPPGRAHAG